MSAKKLRVLGYGRVSTRGQFLKGTSVEHQKSSIQKECKKEGFKLADFISDDGVSGKTIKNRPAIQKVEEFANANKFDYLMFTKLDRVGRSVRELENFWKLMEDDYGLRLYCVDQPAIHDPKFGKMMRQQLSIFAEFERDLIMERTTENRLANWQDGKSRGVGKLPYGYDWDPVNKCNIEHPERARWYKKIVSLYSHEHFCYADVANWLNDNAIEPPLARSKRWSDTTVGNILKNPAYTGEPVIYNQYNKQGKLKPEAEWVKTTYPEMIKKDRWNQIQGLIQFNKSKPKKHYKPPERFIANNILYCGECGGRIRGKLPRSDQAIYICEYKRRTAKELKMKGRDRCILKRIDADKADEEIFLDIAHLLSDPSAYAKEWLKDEDLAEIESRIKRLSVRIKDREEQIKDNTKELSRLKPVARKEMRALLDKDEKELQKDERLLSEAQAEKGFYDNKIDKMAEYEKVITELEKAIAKAPTYKAKIKSVSKKLQFQNEVHRKIFEHLINLPTKEQQRILESVISPEAGGKVIVRYLTGNDLVDDISGYTKADLARPLTDRKPVLEPDFKIDLNKIIALLTSLKNKDLLNVINLY